MVALLHRRYYPRWCLALLWGAMEAVVAATAAAVVTTVLLVLGLVLGLVVQ